MGVTVPNPAIYSIEDAGFPKTLEFAASTVVFANGGTAHADHPVCTRILVLPSPQAERLTMVRGIEDARSAVAF